MLFYCIVLRTCLCQAWLSGYVPGILNFQKQRQNQSYHDQIYQNQQQQQQHKQSRSMTSEMKYFQRYDVATTSYHFITGRIDLHLCDDTPPDRGNIYTVPSLYNTDLDITWPYSGSQFFTLEFYKGIIVPL